MPECLLCENTFHSQAPLVHSDTLRVHLGQWTTGVLNQKTSREKKESKNSRVKGVGMSGKMMFH